MFKNCQRIWLGMYDSNQPTTDEKQIKDFMVAKYEKKMYYSDPVSQKLKNGIQSNPTVTTVTTTYQVNIKYFIIVYVYLYMCIYRNLVKILHQP